MEKQDKQSYPKDKSDSSTLKSIFNNLIEPSSKNLSPKKSQKVKLLNVCLLFSIFASIIFSIIPDLIFTSSYNNPVIGLAILSALLIAYFFNRKNFYNISTLTTLFTTIGAVLFLSYNDINMLPFIVIAIFLGAMFLRLRQFIALSIIVSILSLLWPITIFNLKFLDVIFGVFSFVILCTIFIVLIVWHREKLVKLDLARYVDVKKKLNMEKSRAETILDVAGAMFLALNKKGEISRINKKGLRILECNDCKDIVGKSWVDNFIPKEFQPKVRDIFNKLLNEEFDTKKTVENPILTTKGNIRYISWQNTLLRGKDGQIIGTLSSGLDTTEQHFAKQALEKRINELKCLYTVSNMSQKYRFNLDRLFQQVVTYIKNECKTPIILGCKIVYNEKIFKSRNYKKSSFSYKSEIFAGGKSIGFIQVFYKTNNKKTSENKKYWQNIIDAISQILSKSVEAYLGDKKIREFVSIASHQLNTPLTIIRWLSEDLLTNKKDKLDSNMKETLKKLHDSTIRMIRLINNLLNVSRLESGSVRVNPAKINLTKFIEEIISEFKHKFKKQPCKIETKHLDTLNKKISIDKILFRQVFTNLLDNAVKYSTEGRCLVEVKTYKKNDSIVVEIHDKGIGIDEKEHSSIFEKFFRSKLAEKLDPDGSGLGLYICKMITQAYGGKIWFKSDKKLGTSFFFTIPLEGMKRSTGKKRLIPINFK